MKRIGSGLASDLAALADVWAMPFTPKAEASTIDSKPRDSWTSPWGALSQIGEPRTGVDLTCHFCSLLFSVSASLPGGTPPSQKLDVFPTKLRVERRFGFGNTNCSGISPQRGFSPKTKDISVHVTEHRLGFVVELKFPL